MKTNKKLILVALVSTLGLVACDDEIYAKPTDYDGKIVTFEDNREVYHNAIDVILDSYHDGSLSSDVLNDVLYQYSMSIFGQYNTVVKSYTTGQTTLKAAAADFRDGNADFTTIDGFINNHSIYEVKKSDGSRDNDASRKQVVAKYDLIEDTISKDLYSHIDTESFKERGVFKEEKFLSHLYFDRYNVKKFSDIDDADKFSVVFTPDVEKTQVFGNYLHREYYQDSVVDEANAKYTYVEEEIIPEIYRELLTQQYILEESYSSLGRSSARKVNILKIPSREGYPLASQKLARVVRDEITSGLVTDVKEEFKKVENALKGIPNSATNLLDSELVSLLDAAGGASSFVAAGSPAYYKGTDYGNMMDQYSKIDKDPIKTDSTIESDFTGSYKYSKEVGKEIKTNTIKGNSYVTSDWFVRGSSIENATTDITNRLFNSNIAYFLDATDANAEHGEWNKNYIITDRWNGSEYAKPANENEYLCKINGHYFLKAQSVPAGSDPEKDDILFTDGSGNYYIVEVVEAVNTRKLNDTIETPYDWRATGEDNKQDIVNKVCQLVAEKESFSSTSNEYWLEKAGVEFHDETVYEYFKNNYPDLYDEDED